MNELMLIPAFLSAKSTKWWRSSSIQLAHSVSTSVTFSLRWVHISNMQSTKSMAYICVKLYTHTLPYMKTVVTTYSQCMQDIIIHAWLKTVESEYKLLHGINNAIYIKLHVGHFNHGLMYSQQSCNLHTSASCTVTCPS